MCSWLDVSGGGILKGGELCARSSSSEPPLSALLSSISWAIKKWTRPPGRDPAIPAAGGGTSKASRRGAKKAPPGAARQIKAACRGGTRQSPPPKAAHLKRPGGARRKLRRAQHGKSKAAGGRAPAIPAAWKAANQRTFPTTIYMPKRHEIHVIIETRGSLTGQGGPQLENIVRRKKQECAQNMCIIDKMLRKFSLFLRDISQEILERRSKNC